MSFGQRLGDPVDSEVADLRAVEVAGLTELTKAAAREDRGT